MVKHHEAIVHFPIALIITTFIFGIIGLVYKRELFKEIIFWNILVSLLTCIGALYTGFGEQDEVTDFRLREILELHQRNAYFMLIGITGLTAWMAFRRKIMDRMEYSAWMSLFFIISASVAYQGFIGHQMSRKQTEQIIQMHVSKPKVPSEEAATNWNF